MWRRLLTGVLSAVLAYVVGGFAGGALVYLLSQNRHDRALEAQMTGAFVLGPLAAVIGFLVGAMWPRKARPTSPTAD